jgi:hypothetical protein
MIYFLQLQLMGFVFLIAGYALSRFEGGLTPRSKPIAWLFFGNVVLFLIWYKG